MRNYLLITADQLRYDALGFMGRFPVETPNIDRLAREGVVFSNAYCSSPICVAARASIMTGRLPCETGVYYNDQAWSDDMPTLPGRLGDNGYHCTEVGKTHFRPNRRHAGFHRLWCCDDYKRELEDMGHSAEAPRSWKGLNLWSYKTTPTDLPPELYYTVRTADEAVRELRVIRERRRCERNGYEGFFMWMSFLSPHHPCDPPEPWFSKYADADMPPYVKTPEEVEHYSAPVKRWYDFWQRIDDETADKIRRQYLGDIALIDEQIGRVLDTLEELGIRDNTSIVVSSDHGEYLGDHGMHQKAFFHDCASKIPFIFNGPDFQRGVTIDAPVSAIDLYPTLLDLELLWPGQTRDERGRLIYPHAEELDARSLAPALTGDGEADPDRVIVCESGIHGRNLMLRQGEWKFNTYAETAEYDVFNLRDDPDELKNLNDSLGLADMSEALRETRNEMLPRMARHQGSRYFFKSKLRAVFT